MNKLTDSTDEDDQALPSLEFDPDEYREDIAEFDLTKEQQDEFLRTLWNIMSTMVDIGWGVDSVQILLPEIFEKAGRDSDNLLEQKNSKNHCEYKAHRQPKGVSRKDKP